VWVLRAPEAVRRVWHVTFEYAPIAKVGGLAEAVKGWVRAGTSVGYDVVVVMPSHGVHLDPSRAVPLRQLPISACGTRRGVDGREYPYCIGFECEGNTREGA